MQALSRHEDSPGSLATLCVFTVSWPRRRRKEKGCPSFLCHHSGILPDVSLLHLASSLPSSVSPPRFINLPVLASDLQAT